MRNRRCEGRRARSARVLTEGDEGGQGEGIEVAVRVDIRKHRSGWAGRETEGGEDAAEPVFSKKPMTPPCRKRSRSPSASMSASEARKFPSRSIVNLSRSKTVVPADASTVPPAAQKNETSKAIEIRRGPPPSRIRVADHAGRSGCASLVLVAIRDPRDSGSSLSDVHGRRSSRLWNSRADSTRRASGRE
jgi:hypothetical protein